MDWLIREKIRIFYLRRQDFDSLQLDIFGQSPVQTDWECHLPIVPANRTEEQKFYGNHSDSDKFGGLVFSSGAREFPFPKSFLLKSPPPTKFSLKLNLTVKSLLLAALHNGRRQYQSSFIFILSLELLFVRRLMCHSFQENVFMCPHDFGFLAKTAIYACPNMTKEKYCTSWLTVREWPGQHSQFFRWFLAVQDSSIGDLVTH